MGKDYYKILGVNKGSTKDEIKKAFRTLAHKYHPDKKGGDEARFKEVNEAYSILSDDKRREQYDAFGSEFVNGPQGGAQGFGGFDFSQFTNSQGFGQSFDFGDIFGDFFGGRSSRVKRGRDISIDVELTFEESVFGVERNILLNKTSICTVCTGTGGDTGTEFSTCGTCNGKGRIHEARQTFFGAFSTESICGTCLGKGKTPKVKCGACHGAGISKKEHDIKVKIPPGIDNGEMIRLSGMGEAVASGVSGDLYIKVHVRSHPVFKKDGFNLHMDLKVRLSDMLIGGEQTVKTLDGDIIVKIPERVAFGEILRIRGRGIPRERGGRGDLLIRINIELPQKLSKDARKKIEDMRKEGL